MWNATLKGLYAHKLRLALTALSIVLGVAFVSGAFVLTDTLDKVFVKLFADATASTDVVVRSKAFFEDEGITNDREPVSENTLAAVKKVPGVEQAEGNVSGFAQIIDKSGKPIANGGAPTFGVSYPHTAASPLRLRSGRPPRGSGEIVIDRQTAETGKFKLGDTIDVQLKGPPAKFVLVGIIGFGDSDNLAGATFSAFDLPAARVALEYPSGFEEIAIVAEDGVKSSDLSERIQKELPDSIESLTGRDLSAEQASAIQDQLGFFGVVLLVFAGIALFVGAFIIYNTFSIIVAQRTREFALLKALGARTSQILTSVVVESAATGLFASAAGLGFGILVANGLQSLLSAFGLELPDSGSVVLPRTIVVSLILGVGVTVLAAVLPARKAARVSPMSALRDSGPGAETASPIRPVLGSSMGSVGISILSLGLFGDGVHQRPSLVGAGALFIFLGAATLAPVVSGPLSRFIAAPIAALLGLRGRLARENAARSPRRTASTAAALMIGLALVSFVAVFTNSTKASVRKTLDESLGADFVIQPEQGQGFRGFSANVAKDIRDLPESGAVSSFRFGEWRFDGKGNRSLAAADPTTVAELTKIKLSAGAIEGLSDGGVLVGDEAAEKDGLKLGDVVPMSFAKTGLRPQKVEGIIAESGFIGRGYLIALSTYEANYTQQTDLFLMVKSAPGVALSDARRAVSKIVDESPNVIIMDQEQFKESQEDDINRLFGLVTALLALSIVIALLGITNTLALSVLERTRELGLLRAVGMSRRQVRSMVRWESVVIAILGAVFGLPLGVFLAAAMTRALKDQGFGAFVVPFGQLVIFVVMAGFAGIIAAVFPARRASRLNVLDAIATE